MASNQRMSPKNTPKIALIPLEIKSNTSPDTQLTASPNTPPSRSNAVGGGGGILCASVVKGKNRKLKAIIAMITKQMYFFSLREMPRRDIFFIINFFINYGAGGGDINFAAIHASNIF